MISVVGWFLWNWGELTYEKKQLDEDGNPQTNFSIKDFSKKKYTYWIGSFVSIALLLWFGSQNMDLHPFEAITGEKLKWNDSFYLLSGVVFEAIIFGITVVHKYFKKKSQ